jgi:hypothetical protein
MSIAKLMAVILVVFNFTISASAEFNPTPIEGVKIDGEVKDIQWSEDGNFLLVLSTNNVFYIYQLQDESSVFTLSL